MKNLERRKMILIFGVIFTAIVFLLRLFYLQIIDERWENEARLIVESRETIPPPRGIIKDRKGKVLADNILAYHLKLFPNDFLKHQKNFDTLAFCNLLGISKADFEERMQKAFGADEPYLITTSLNKNSFEKNKTHLQKIPGLSFKELPSGIMVLVKASRFFIEDTMALATWLDIKPEFLKRKLKQAWKQPILLNNKRIFLPMIPVDDFKKIAEQLYLFPGFLEEPVLQRNYPEKTAAQVLGYVAEVSPFDLQQETYYRLGDLAGMTGLEQAYEKELRGEKGIFFYLRNAYSAKVKLIERDQNEIAIPGENLELGLDANLQSYGEMLMQNKTGSIVALNPKTGEILAMVSASSYDPNLLTGKNFSKNYQELLKNELETPLYNKAIKATYRPGSIFKTIQALVGLQEKVITFNTAIACNKNLIGCHNHPPVQNIEQALQYSCNPYFYTVFKKLIQRGQKPSIFREAAEHLNTWNSYVKSFGLGQMPSVDLWGAFKGMVPDTDFYDRLYGQSRWAFSTIYSLSIGEGELLVTPLQMANFAAILANRGHYFPPYFVRKKDEQGNLILPKKQNTLVDSIYFEPIVKSMEKTVSQGTGRSAQVRGIAVAGKTGTVQTQSIKAQKQKINPDLRDHGVFIAFAPVENPQIALAVYVEYSGFGASFAAPIAGLMIEKYLKGEVENKKQESYYKNAILRKNEPIQHVE